MYQVFVFLLVFERFPRCRKACFLLVFNEKPLGNVSPGVAKHVSSPHGLIGAFCNITTRVMNKDQLVRPLIRQAFLHAPLTIYKYIRHIQTRMQTTKTGLPKTYIQTRVPIKVEAII